MECLSLHPRCVKDARMKCRCTTNECAALNANCGGMQDALLPSVVHLADISEIWRLLNVTQLCHIFYV